MTSSHSLSLPLGQLLAVELSARFVLGQASQLAIDIELAEDRLRNSIGEVELKSLLPFVDSQHAMHHLYRARVTSLRRLPTTSLCETILLEKKDTGQIVTPADLRKTLDDLQITACPLDPLKVKSIPKKEEEKREEKDESKEEKEKKWSASTVKVTQEAVLNKKRDFSQTKSQKDEDDQKKLKKSVVAERSKRAKKTVEKTSGDEVCVAPLSANLQNLIATLGHPSPP